MGTVAEDYTMATMIQDSEGLNSRIGNIITLFYETLQGDKSLAEFAVEIDDLADECGFDCDPLGKVDVARIVLIAHMKNRALAKVCTSCKNTTILG